MLTLTRRLQAAADAVPLNCRFADVGTDHARLPVWLLLQGRITGAIATDLRPGPLARAAATAADFGQREGVDLRLCDGLTGLSPHEANCITITGMGGETIRSILAAAPWTKTGTRLILQPQSAQEQLRQWLLEAGYRVEQERCLLEEGHWYSLLTVTGGEDTPLTPAEALMGRPDRWAAGDPWGRYLLHQTERLSRQWEGLMQASEPDEARLIQLSELLETLQTWLEEYPIEEEL